jgi:hypothetical protein
VQVVSDVINSLQEQNAILKQSLSGMTFLGFFFGKIIVKVTVEVTTDRLFAGNTRMDINPTMSRNGPTLGTLAEGSGESFSFMFLGIRHWIRS